jgi:amino acid transporter
MRPLAALVDLLFGKPLASYEERAEKIGTSSAIPIFGLDALGSAAYGPEAALTILIPLGMSGIQYIVPISAAIILLLGIVCSSYYQTIGAYPGGGGSYTVASQNLGKYPGVLAAAALMIDYVLVVAVGISAGVGALVSALPDWQPYTLVLCLFFLTVITIVNLRGVRDSGAFFLFPTYLFVLSLFSVIALGVWKTWLSGGHPIPIVRPPGHGAAQEAASLWLLLRAFSSGCTAMTGVEAVSNGVMAFREPRVKSARQTLIIIIVLLMMLLAGIAYLCRVYGICATEPGQSGYRSVLSQLISAVAGRGWFYYMAIGFIVLALTLQANTAFADFPRLCRAVAQNGYLPHLFTLRGRRLVYSQGIYILAFLAGSLLVIFGGVTDRLIPLFAVGAFLAFTLSQAGMVVHWKRKGGPHALTSMLINGLGAIATAITTAVIIVSKFVEGAWITMLVIPAIIVLMLRIRRHYARVAREVGGRTMLDVENLQPPLVVVPIEEWNKTSEKAIQFALTVSPDVIAVHVDFTKDDKEVEPSTKWREYVEIPAQKAGLPAPRLVVLRSPYRLVITPIFDYILELEQSHPTRQIAVIVPTLVQAHWYEHFLHNQRGKLLSALLLLKGNQRIVIINVPWYFNASNS